MGKHTTPQQRIFDALKELTKAGDTRTVLKAYALMEAWGKLIHSVNYSETELRRLVKAICALILGR